MILLIVSIVLQILAAFLALRLIPLTGRRPAWLLISLGMLMMAVRRSITIYQSWTGAIQESPAGGSEFVTLMTSAFMLTGILLIRPLFERMRDSAKNIEFERRRFFSVLDEIPAVVALCAPGGLIPYTNRQFIKNFGNPRGRRCYEMLYKSSAPCLECPASQVLETGQIKAFEWIASDGRTYHMHFCPFEDVDGSQLVLELGIDVTDLKKSEAEKVRLASAIEQATEIVITTDVKGTVTYVNPAFEALSGYTRDEAQGADICNLTKFSGRELNSQIRDCFAEGGVWAGRCICCRKDGSRYEVEITISPVRNEAGEIINYVLLERDVTRESELERQVMQFQKMEAIGTLAGGIAHDFNNILTAIMGYTELALLKIPKESNERDYLVKISSAVCRAKNLVKKILDFSRQHQSERKPVRIDAIAGEVLEMLRATIPTTIEIEHALESNRAILADPVQIQQILMNLCLNSAQAVKSSGGRICVRLEDVMVDSELAKNRYPLLKPGPYVRMSVIDNGRGIDRSIIDRVFDPYFTTKGPGEGTGLGLSVVQGIVTSYGGALTVESDPGTGSRFDVLLPIVEQTREISGPKSLLIPVGTENILFIDDELEIAAAGSEVLRSLGYNVTAKSSSIEALDEFRARPDEFDLVITDLTMPQISGTDLARQILEIRSSTPLILCTGFGEAVSQEQAVEMGIGKVLMKPWTVRDLSRTVREVLDLGNKKGS